ncbi:FAD/NAD(P)-binding protein [Streptomyces sp. NPDC005336]|uniref:FAD/NAD(P)-binding protein n=1 Tax=unclassified Streptomyces TaxID=2593676 RepID=UPI0033AF6F52
MNTRRLDVCLIGGGPRGLSAFERLCANAKELAPGVPVTVHLVDPYPPGAGQVWRSAQSRHLLTNTVASQTTVFTDESVEMAGPLVPGPSLYEWARFLTLMGPEDDQVYDAWVLAEARGLTPDTYPTRAFCGHYLEWVFRRVRNTAPPSVTTVVHRTRAVALSEEEPGGTQTVQLENGDVLTGLHAVVLAQGHLPLWSSERETRLAAFAQEHGLRYVAPANPADVDLSGLTAEDHVALLGLGLNFFDHLALLTEGRGGSYRRRPDGSLAYVPSGREPRISAGSRRGVPFHARGENQKGAHGRHLPLVLTPDTIGRLLAKATAEGGLDFRSDIWPLVAKEAGTVYYTTLLTARGQEAEARRLRAAYLTAPPGSEEEQRALADAGIEAVDRWDWERIARPDAGRTFGSPEEFRTWLLERLRTDVAEAYAGNVHGPLKAALDVLRDLRNEVRLLVDHGGLTGASHRDHLDEWYTPLNAFLSIGPPARRIEEAVALIEAGTLRVLGPGTRAHADPLEGAFIVEAAGVAGSRCRATVLIDARLPAVDLRSTADPLLSGMLANGQCRPHVVTGGDGTAYETGGLAITERPFHVVDAHGRPHPRLFAYGVPTESVHWATAAGIRPGVNSVTLGDSDAIARSVLGLSGAADADVHPVQAVAQ